MKKRAVVCFDTDIDAVDGRNERWKTKHFSSNFRRLDNNLDLFRNYLFGYSTIAISTRNSTEPYLPIPGRVPGLMPT